jgi:hypothetical protein
MGPPQARQPPASDRPTMPPFLHSISARCIQGCLLRGNQRGARIASAAINPPRAGRVAKSPGIRRQVAIRFDIDHEEGA